MEFLEVSQRAAGEVAVEWVVEESDRLLDNGRGSNNDLVGFVGVFFFRIVICAFWGCLIDVEFIELSRR